MFNSCVKLSFNFFTIFFDMCLIAVHQRGEIAQWHSVADFDLIVVRNGFCNSDSMCPSYAPGPDLRLGIV